MAPRTRPGAAQRRPDTRADSPDFSVVGIGASAGGLAASSRFLEALPDSPRMAFVVVLHLSPEHESSAAEILQRSTSMPVKQISGSTPIEPDHVYVIPPTYGLSMVDGRVDLTPLERKRGRPIVIDLFFRTLAHAHRERAVAIVLSGTGGDGSVGIGDIKEAGGIVLAQSPDDAEFDGMPTSAIATGKVDIVLPAGDLAEKLVELWTNAQRIELPDAADVGVDAVAPSSPEGAEEALRRIMTTLQRRTGHDFKHYKRATILRRIERRLQVNGLPQLQAYEQFLEAHPGETAPLLADMLIGVTNFFRDREAFESLERTVIPELFDDAPLDESLRVWVPGCSSGEEAYSILMLLSQQNLSASRSRALQLFASDIDAPALARGREGLYPQSIVADVPPPLLRRWMTMGDSGYRVNQALREQVLFAQHNILRDPPFSRVDLVSCRNLLIYLNRDVQKEILQMFHFALRPGGYLFLGSSETADVASRLFVPIDKLHRLYRSISTTRSALRTLPRFPLGGLDHKRPVAATVASTPPVTISAVHAQLLLDEAPPSILVKPDGEIVHSLGAEPYLRFAPGVPTQNVLEAVMPDLRPGVRTALFQASQAAEAIPTLAIRISRDDTVFEVTVRGRTAHHDDWPGDLLLLTFHEVPSPPDTDSEALGAGGKDPLVHQLEADLSRKDLQLHGVITQYETSVEDLRASNEELQAINEELRSATEELETSKEELQSTNEELITVNHELKTKAEETAEINDDLQNLMSSTGIATIFVDRDMRIKRFAPAAEQIFNIIPGDIGRSLLDITHKLIYPTMAEDADAAFRSLSAIEREIASVQGRWYLARAVPYRTGEDRIDGAALTFIDITSRHRAERSVELDQERMQLIASSMPDFAILTLDANGFFTSWSAGAERLFGYEEAEILGRPVDIIFTPEDRAAGMPQAEMRNALEHGRASDERWHLRKDGTRVFVSGIMAPMRLGRLKGFAKIARDMTDRAQADASRDIALKSAVNEASSAAQESRLKDEFLAIMSHELKHPLNLIQVNAQLLLGLPEAAKVPSIAKVAATIQRTVRNQARIIDDLLDISRTRNGKLVLDKSPARIADLLQSSFALARRQAEEKGLDFTLDVVDDALVVDADPVRIEQVALNLLGNALKFTPSGGRVTVRLARDGADAMLEVSDTGRGIAPSFLPHIFELFRQGDSKTTREHGGLGIGLALVHDIVELHGGRVEASSPGTGKGATFRVWLPLRTDVATPSAAVAADGNALSGLSILYVDDSKETLELFSTVLEMEGARVIAVGSGEEALAAVADTDVDLIISDIGMPGMDGYALIGELRNRPRTASVPALALTGYGRAQDVQRALACGFNGHVDKPVDLDRLRTVVKSLQIRSGT